MEKQNKDKSAEINFLTFQILLHIKMTGYSPNNVLAAYLLVDDMNGKKISLRSAFSKIRRNVNYLDDELIEKINSYQCIRTKLKKDCNNE